MAARKPASLRKRKADEPEDELLPDTRSGGPTRISADFYPTPRALADANVRLVQECALECSRLKTPDLILETSAGDGVFCEAAREVFGPKPLLYAVELRLEARVHDPAFREQFRVHAERGRWEDAPVTTAKIQEVVRAGGSVVVLGNPPNLLAERHIGLMLDRLGHSSVPHPMPRFISQLLPSGFLGGSERYQNLWTTPTAASLVPPPARGGLRHLRQVVGRPDFTGQGGGGYEYMVFLWQIGWRSSRFEGGFLEW